MSFPVCFKDNMSNAEFFGVVLILKICRDFSLGELIILRSASLVKAR